MARDAGRAPANANPADGAKGYRLPGEPPDSRPVLACEAFWRDSDEEQAYERAVREIRPHARFHAPRPAADGSRAEKDREAGDTWLGMAALCTEITCLAEGLDVGRRVAGMPRWMSQREWEARQNALKRQAWRGEQ